MNFDLNDDQKMLVGTVEDFCKKESPLERLRKLREAPLGWDKATWATMGELGWLTVLFDEDVGGLGGTFVDAALIIEQLGKTLVAEPYVPSVVLGGVSIRDAGSDDQKQKYLTPMIEGQTSLALAYAEAQGRFELGDLATRAEKAGDGYKLSGEKRWVLNGQGAEHLVVSARTSGSSADREGVSLFVIPRDAAGVKVTTVSCMDSHKAAMIDFDGAQAELLGDEGAALPILEKVIDYGAAAACAEAAGIMDVVLNMTRDYLCERQQFGAKIGSFQALQHRLVDMFVEVQLMKSASIQAMIKADHDDPLERAHAISAAKCQLANGGGYVVRQGTQLHGGIGVTDEHDVGLFFKRMAILSALYGDEEYHTARFAQLPRFTQHVAAE